MWAHAEDFIDYLDTAAEERPLREPNPHAERLAEVLTKLLRADVGPPALADLRAAAQRLIAGECCAFLERVDAKQERWRPFHTRLINLGPNDTVITLNYDRVVERLDEAYEAHARRERWERRNLLSVIQPGHPEHVKKARVGGRCPLLKLHGSVDWMVSPGPPPRIEVTGQPNFALQCPDSELAMATPGPSKHRMATSFEDLWTLACEALQAADAVVFVGYRFPETDAYARERLLTAIAGDGSRGGTHHLAMHIVLGHPDRDSIRLHALLHHVGRKNRPGGEGKARVDGARNFWVTTHPLFAQDFFTVVTRDEL